MVLLLIWEALLLLGQPFPNNFLQFQNCLVKIFAGRIQLINFDQHFGFPLFGLQSFTHSVGDRGFVKGLISLHCHFDFIADADQEESAFSAVDCNFANEFVKCLRVKFFSDRTNTRLSRLALLEFLVKFVLQIDHVDARGRSRRYVLHPQLSAVLIFSRWQYRIQIILRPHWPRSWWWRGARWWIWLRWCHCIVSCFRKSLRNQNGSVVLY